MVPNGTVVAIIERASEEERNLRLNIEYARYAHSLTHLNEHSIFMVKLGLLVNKFSVSPISD